MSPTLRRKLRTAMADVCQWCSGPLPCGGCAARNRYYQASRRASLLLAGLCVSCGKRRAGPTFTRCEPCRVKRRSYA
jgi:hypothetical protein